MKDKRKNRIPFCNGNIRRMWEYIKYGLMVIVMLVCGYACTVVWMFVEV